MRVVVATAMRPTLHPRLVNGRFGDPALFVERLHRREAILFDCGDISALSARDLLRIDRLFVSHMHMDHLIGFDTLLRALIGRDKRLRVTGPAGICDRIHHKLQGYEWDLVDRYEAGLVIDVSEIGAEGPFRAARFRFKQRFAWEDVEPSSDPLLDAAQGLTVRTALLEHHGPCLGFALQEAAHVNVWKNRIEDRGLAPGPWLQLLKQAVVAELSNETPIALADGETALLGTLRDLVTVTRGQVVAYVTDVADTPANRAAIVDLVRGADLLFIESRFAAEHAAEARARAHLTTRAAGEIARAAGVRRLETFHYSPRYDDEEAMVGEAQSAFAGKIEEPA